MVHLTDRAINLLIRSIEEQPDKYVWVRSPDFHQQIYISESFEKVWGQKNAKLFENPMSFVDAVVQEVHSDILQQFEKRVNGSIEEKEKSLLVRIQSADNSIVHWRDSCFSLFDTYGNQIGMAGIGEVISESEWYYDLESKITEPGPVELLRQSRYARYIDCEKLKSVEFSRVEIPVHKVKSQYYVLTQKGEVALTRRELECVYCLLSGMTAKQSAKELKISPRTVELYLNQVREKLGCMNKLEISHNIKHIVR